MKRFLATLFVGFLLLSINGCDGDRELPTASNKSPQDQVPPPKPAKAQDAESKPKTPIATLPSPALPKTEPLLTNSPPKEFARVQFPQGNEFEILDALPPIYGQKLTIKLKGKGTTAKTTSEPDNAAVFYVTRYADLEAGEDSFSGPVGVIARWRKLIATIPEMPELKGFDLGNQVTAGVAKFEIDKTAPRDQIVLTGELGVSSEELATPLVGVLLMKGSKPISNVVWISVGNAQVNSN